MAAIAASSLTLIDSGPVGKRWYKTYQVVGPASYDATNGENLTALVAGLASILYGRVESPPVSATPAYFLLSTAVNATGDLIFRYGWTGAAVSSAFQNAANTTNLSTFTSVVTVVGTGQ